MKYQPVDSDGHHAEKRGGDIAVEEEREQGAERVAEDPLLLDVPGRRQREVESAEDEIRGAEGYHELGRGVAAQLRASAQRQYGYQVPCGMARTKEHIHHQQRWGAQHELCGNKMCDVDRLHCDDSSGRRFFYL